jgi:hypothetical protein
MGHSDVVMDLKYNFVGGLGAQLQAATNALSDRDAPGYVPWWPQPDVKLFNVMVHILTETSRHAGHADILREQLDGTVGSGPQGTILHGLDAAYWETYRAKIERAASAWGSAPTT